ncbi:MAG: hypothetical protein ACOH18_04645 [Candidatus Saccharimonadaceae bacterium]
MELLHVLCVLLVLVIAWSGRALWLLKPNHPPQNDSETTIAWVVLFMVLLAAGIVLLNDLVLVLLEVYVPGIFGSLFWIPYGLAYLASIVVSIGGFLICRGADIERAEIRRRQRQVTG